MKYLGDKKSWLIAFVSSLGILLVNIVFTPSVYRWSGATVTEYQVAFVSIVFFIARIIWFYVVILWRLLWGT